MRGLLLIKDSHFVAKDLLKLSNATNTCLISQNIVFISLLTSKYLRMFSTSDLPISLPSIEKSYKFPLKDSSVD